MPTMKDLLNVIVLLVALGELTSAGDDGEYFPFHMYQNSQRLRYSSADDGRGSLSGLTSLYSKLGRQTAAVGLQAFAFPGKPTAPPCVELPLKSYCTVDYQYPIDFIASCIENDPDVFKQLSGQVLWSCETLPNLPAAELLPANEPSTTEQPAASPETEIIAPVDPEPLQPMRMGGLRASSPGIQPDRNARQMPMKPAFPSKNSASIRATPTRGRAPLTRRVRRDSSPHHHIEHGVNYTYEVCSSVVKNDLGIVRAESEAGEWSPLVQIGECKQIIRAEECSRLYQPCSYLCSYLKSECTQRFTMQRLLTCSSERGLYLDWFRIPTSCGCQVEFSDKHAPSTPSPQGGD